MSATNTDLKGVVFMHWPGNATSGAMIFVYQREVLAENNYELNAYLRTASMWSGPTKEITIDGLVMLGYEISYENITEVTEKLTNWTGE